MDSQTPEMTSLSLSMVQKYVSEAGPLPTRYQQWCQPWRPKCRGLLKHSMGGYPLENKWLKMGTTKKPSGVKGSNVRAGQHRCKYK